VSTALSRTIKVDTTAPTTLTMTSPTMLNKKQPTVIGTTEAGSVVTISVGGKTYTGTADASGNYSIAITADLTEGDNLLSITATDAAGNVSTALSQTIKVDTTPPSLTVPTGPFNFAATRTGRTESGATVTVNGKPVTVDGSGNFTIPNTLATGTYTVEAKDTVGNKSTKTITVDVTPPKTPTMVTPNLINKKKPIIEGTAEAGSSVKILVGGKTYTTTANKTGKYSFTIPDDLKEGGNLFTITATDAAGNISPALTKTIKVDTISPIFKVPTTAFNPSINPQTITASEISTFTIKNSSNNIVYTSSPGQTSFMIPKTLTTGVYTVTATDTAGNTTNQMITVDITGPSILNIISTLFKKDPKGNLVPVVNTVPWPSTNVPPSIIFNQAADSYSLSVSELAFFTIKNKLDKVVYQKADQLTKELLLSPRFLISGLYNLESKDALGNISKNAFSVVNNIGSTKLSAVNNLKLAMSAMKTKNLEITLSSDNIIFNQSRTTSKITSSELALFLIKDSFGKIIYQSPQLQTELFLYPRFFQTGDYILESTTATGQTSVNKFSVTKM